MAILPHEQILRLHAAVVSADLASARATLLGGIDSVFLSGLPLCTSQSSQILSDLHGLNAVEQLGNGMVPLRIWLANALGLVGQRLEADVFQNALGATGRDKTIARSNVRSEVDEIADELSRIARSALLADDRELRRSLYEVEALLARAPHHVEARMLQNRIRLAVDALEKMVCDFRSDEDGDAPDAAAQVAVQSWLRTPPSSITGRARELLELTSHAGSEGVLICGLGGIGKTTVALALVQLLLPQYPDLQISIDLRGTSPESNFPEDAMRQVVRAFLPAAPLPKRSEELANVYRGVLTGQRVLILLEDARDQEQVAPLLPPSGSMLVITSRRRFTLSSIHALSLDKLDEIDGQVLLQHLAPRLDDAAARELLELCCGVPLALQLAGGALMHRLDITPDAYIERLKAAQSRYDLIEAAFSVSLALLDPIAQILWSRLSMFMSSFSLSEARDAGRMAAYTSEAMRDLLAYGMLRLDPGTELYSFPRSGRHLAMSLLTASDRAAVEQRMIKKTRSPRRSRADRRVPVPAKQWLSVLHSVELTPRGWRGAIGAARRASYRPAEATYLEMMVMAERGPLSGVVTLAEQALAVHRECGDRAGESRILTKLVGLHKRQQNDCYAAELGQQALVIHRELGDRGNESVMLGMLCELHERLKNHRLAVEYGEQALTIFRALGDLSKESIISNILARLRQTHT